MVEDVLESRPPGPMGISYAVGNTPTYSIHNDAEGSGAGWEMVAFVTSCAAQTPTPCSGRGVCDATDSYCQCAYPYFGPQCEIGDGVMTPLRTAASGLAPLTLHSRVIENMAHFRLDLVGDIKWVGIMISPHPEDAGGDNMVRFVT